jgi:lambda family phage tail tape measure protein
MANEDLRVRITAQIAGLDQVESLKNAVRQLQSTAAPAAADLQKLKNAATQLGSATDRTESDLRKSINALKDVRAQLTLTGTEYKSLTKTINEYQRALDKATGTQRNGGGSRTGQAIGAIASGAIFGGPEGFLGGLGGAALGAVTGGGAVAGAFAGAAAGAAAGVFRQQITGASDYASEISRLQIALKGVSTDQGEFNNSLRFIKDSAPQFLTSLGDATKNYTRLQASVRGTGGSIEDTQAVFRGLSAAIVATGGGTEQLNGAMLAASQVFSKGKVSAEELRGQIGERLPGAFTIFAQAVNMTPQQLDKALEQGKVSTEDFVKFSQELFKRYGDAAKSIGDSPFAASIRFQLAMDNFRLAAGQSLLPIITAFQNFGTEALNSLTRVAEGTTNWQKAIGNTFDNVSKLIGGVQGLKNILSGLTKTLIVLGTTMAGVFAVQNIGTFVAAFKTVVTVTTTLVKVTRELLTLEKAITALKAIQGALQALISGAASGAVKGLRSAKGVGAVVGLSAGALAAAAFKDDIDKAISGVVDSIGGKFNDLFKMPELGGNFGGVQPPLPPGADDGDAEKDAARLAQEQQQYNEATARAKIELDNRIHRNALELVRKRYEYERELQEKTADNWVKSYTGASRSAAGIITRALSEMESLRGREMNSALNVQSAERAVAAAKQLAAVTGGGGGSGGGASGRIIEYLTGDRSHRGYRADHGGSNYHEHVAFETAKQMRAAMQALQAAGIRIGSTTGGRHAAGSYHYSGQAFDVPASQVPVGQEQALSRRVRSVLAAAGFTGMGIGGGGNAPVGSARAALQRRNVGNVGEVAEAGADLAQATAIAKLDEAQIKRLRELLSDSTVLDYTEQIREQTRELQNQNAIQELRNRLLAEGRSPEYIDAEVRRAEALQQFSAQLQPAEEKLEQLRKKFAETKDVKLGEDIKLLEAAVAALKARFPELTAELDKFIKKQQEAKDIAEGFKGSLGASLTTYYKQLSDFGGAVGGAITGAFKGLEDQLTNFVTTGKANFAELARSILADMARIAIQQAVIKPLLGGVMNLFNIPLPNAKGNAFAQNGIVPFAMGGVVDKPTLFKFANGGAGQLGLMGEAGPEAIMPLRRGRDGKLGVVAQGDGGGVTVNVSVDATGSSVQGDAGRGQELGRAVAQAVQAELVRQKRPGGLLAA